MFEYYIFYKPFQVLTQFTAEGEKQTLSDYFPALSKNIYPVGRLDFDSEGLLLLTNDKALTHQLLDPQFKHKRTYWAQVEGIINEEAIQQLQKGVLINVTGKEYKTRHAIASIFENEPQVPDRNPPIRFRKDKPTSWLSLTLTEGKNRQVRKMTAATGFPTLRLIRYSIGNVTVDGMQPGMVKTIDAGIKNDLFGQ
jgi:23S rRNA pseudouridine2457 synthase